jgi:heme-degrading monooxygenase HmoA
MNVLLRRLALFFAITLVAAVGLATLAARLPDADLAPLQAASVRAQDFNGQVDTSFDAIKRRVTELRGLTPRQDVPEVALTPQQYRERMEADMADADSQKSIEDSRQLMVALGLLDPGVDLYQMELDFRTGIVLGEYDPETKQLYVITGTDLTRPMERVTLAHEFTHALQDQYYDIQRLLPKDSDNSDRDLAVSSLLESDALMSEQLYEIHALSRAERQEKLREEQAMSGQVNMDRVPLVLLEETYFPYVVGPEFLAAVIGRDTLRQAVDSGVGYGPAVNRIFDNPPKSSAQIIHPEKYLNNVVPVEVRFPDLAAALGPGWEERRKDLLGEIDHRILIQQYVNRELGDRAADGWAGDAFSLLRNGDQTAVVVSTRWETPNDASEWFDAYTRAMTARYRQNLQGVDQRANRVLWRTADSQQLLTMDGTSTTMIVAPTLDQVSRLEQALNAGAATPARRLLPPAISLIP